MTAEVCAQVAKARLPRRPSMLKLGTMVGPDAQIAAYMVADRYRGTIYIGVTGFLTRRVLAASRGCDAGLR